MFIKILYHMRRRLVEAIYLIKFVKSYIKANIIWKTFFKKRSTVRIVFDQIMTIKFILHILFIFFFYFRMLQKLLAMLLKFKGNKLNIF